jgi:hypothetical protein
MAAMLSRVLRHAGTQARIRAWVGDMPAAKQWRYIEQAADLDSLIERMRASGLAAWLKDLPREPEARQIERHLTEQSRMVITGIVDLFPATWDRAAQWLRLLPELVQLKRLLAEQPDMAAMDDAALYRQVAEWSLEERRAFLLNTPFAEVVDGKRTPAAVWWDEFSKRLPSMPPREARVFRRLGKLLLAYWQELNEARYQARRRARESGRSENMGADVLTQWQFQDRLQQRVRELMFSGDPFHSGLILGFGVISMLQLERVRALLLAYVHGWQAELNLPEAG